MRQAALAAAFFLLSGAATADEMVAVCYGYGCSAQAEIRYSTGQQGEVRRLLAYAGDPASERIILGKVVGRLYRWAGEQSPVRDDRGGNYADSDAPGKMDCIDHSTSTTRLLEMLQRLGYLRWHRVLAAEPRYLLGVIANHWSAVIEEKGGGRYVVDSWFVNNGEPAVILPLDEWKKGAGPDV